MRFYTIVPVSDSRGRRGPTVGPIRVPLVEPLMPPEKVDVTYTETTISLTWPRQPEDVDRSLRHSPRLPRRLHHQPSLRLRHLRLRLHQRQHPRRRPCQRQPPSRQPLKLLRRPLLRRPLRRCLHPRCPRLMRLRRFRLRWSGPSKRRLYKKPPGRLSCTSISKRKARATLRRPRRLRRPGQSRRRPPPQPRRRKPRPRPHLVTATTSTRRPHQRRGAPAPAPYRTHRTQRT